MARFRDQITAFTAGEISPKAYGRMDIDSYKQACETIENAIVYPQGGGGRRPGTQFITNEWKRLYDNVTIDPSEIRLVPFTVSATERYILIFTTIDVHQAVPPGFENGNIGVLAWDVDNKVMLPVRYDGSPIPAKEFTRFTTNQQLKDLSFAQFGNGVFFAQGDRPPFAIVKETTSYVAASVTYNFKLRLYTFDEYTFIGTQGIGPSDPDHLLAEPFRDRNLTTITLTTSSAAVGVRTMTASSALFVSSDVGTQIRVTGALGTVTGVCKITAFTNSTTVTVLITKAFESTTVTSNWSFAAWNVTSGYPKSVCFFENRIIYGGSRTFPNNIWASRVSAISDMRQQHWIDDVPNTVTNADPFSFTITSNILSEIQWLSNGKQLVIGTEKREYLAFGPDSSLSMGPLNFNFSPESAYGSKGIIPVRLENALVFIQRSGQKIREFVFNFQEDSYKGDELLKYSEHMPRRTREVVEEIIYPNSAVTNLGRIVELHYQDIDNQILWCLDDNGGFFGVTRDRDGGISAPHHHQLGETFGTLSTSKVLSMCIMQSDDTTHEDVWFAVRRTINGTPITMLEKMGREFELDHLDSGSTSIRDYPVYSDSAKLVDNHSSPSATLMGLSHLEGKTVVVIADGKYLGEYTVSSGQVVLASVISYAIVGLNYRSYLKTTNLNIGSVIGSSQQAPRSIDTLTLRFNRTIGAKFGYDLDNLDSINFRPPSIDMQDPIPLFTGDKEIAFQQGWFEKLNVYVVQDLPLPMQITMIVSRGFLND